MPFYYAFLDSLCNMFIIPFTQKSEYRQKTPSIYFSKTLFIFRLHSHKNLFNFDRAMSQFTFFVDNKTKNQ